MTDDHDFREPLGRLSAKAGHHPYTAFDWPAALPGDEYWFSPELLSVHGTEYADELSDEQLCALSRWESVNFHSLNVHGIRERLIEVTRRVHTPGFEVPSEFLHHFIGAENERMWSFAAFCMKYGGRIYPDEKLRPPPAGEDPALEDFLVFARILLFERIVGPYHVRLAADARLPPVVRRLDRIRHQDAGRHNASTVRLVRLLWERLAESGPGEEERRAADRRLSEYLRTTMASFYNPAAYRDAGLADGPDLRKRLLDHPVRQAAHARVLRDATDFLHGIGVPVTV
ncbi:diiron oxygenase [Streptomyces sp. WELS2]|uniref:diiron oxygenase n=1 Tax=Streptomyces sp. WELS2 TaxID=2749435 RepID=UPI001C68E64F|nr:diiron oxygenase [Streptomyces sp. WELS2]